MIDKLPGELAESVKRNGRTAWDQLFDKLQQDKLACILGADEKGLAKIQHEAKYIDEIRNLFLSAFN